MRMRMSVCVCGRERECVCVCVCVNEIDFEVFCSVSMCVPIYMHVCVTHMYIRYLYISCQDTCIDIYIYH